MKQTTIKQPIYLYALFIVVALFSAFSGNAQTVTIDKAGNYVAVKAAKTDTASYQATGKTFTTAKGETFPVFISNRGKLFVIRQSAKSGKTYRQYLKL